MAELLRAFEEKIETIELVPEGEGKFEVTVNGDLIYSKLKTNRHAMDGEVLGLVRELI